MGYDGEPLTECSQRFDFTNAAAVHVSGAPIFNALTKPWAKDGCGHLLLYVNGERTSSGGWYMHVSEMWGYPQYMDEDGFRRYLNENGKRELWRIKLGLRQPGQALLRMEQIMSSKWLWQGVRNNCTTFVEQIIEAGEPSVSVLWSSCPAKVGSFSL